MIDPDSVLASHEQHFQKSCAASGMELVLKLHSLVASDYRELQDKYGNTNIGFEKLADLAPFGVTASDQETSIDDGFQAIESEVADGRFPILSVFSDPVGWHIWVAVPAGHSFRLLSRAYQHPTTLEIKDLNLLRQNLIRYRSGKIHFVTYSGAAP